jgi:hypothetical protein
MALNFLFEFYYETAKSKTPRDYQKPAKRGDQQGEKACVLQGNML